MKRITPLTTLLVLLATAPGALFAHPGHHHAMTGKEAAGHLLSDPWHVALIVLAALAALALAVISLRKRSKRP